MRTKKKIAMLVAMAAAAVVLVSLVGSGPALAQMIWLRTSNPAAARESCTVLA